MSVYLGELKTLISCKSMNWLDSSTLRRFTSSRELATQSAIRAWRAPKKLLIRSFALARTHKLAYPGYFLRRLFQGLTR